MATVTGYTAAKMDEIANATIVDADIVGDNLLLERFDGATIDAGDARGPQGIPGTNGTNGTNGAQGPAGPMDMVGPPINLTTAPAQMTVSGLVSGLAKNNVSVISGNTYGIKVDFTLEWSSVDIDARWDIWFRLNGVNIERIRPLRPAITGIAFVPVVGEVFWVPSVTAATDDVEIYAERITAGAPITPSGSATLKRKLWIVDYGVV